MLLCVYTVTEQEILQTFPGEKAGCVCMRVHVQADSSVGP